MFTMRRERGMKVVNRPGVNGPYGKCKACGVGTRSHILEPATYEEYEIVNSEEYDEYVAEFEEETGEEEVELRYRLLDRPTVMCHSCWVPFRADQCDYLAENLEKWTSEPIENTHNIKVFLARWKYHCFDDEDDEGKSNVRLLRTALKEALLNVQ
tara:strand:+ start:12140 stop:12604 length:465 start_codon:yes stop_codon:yes gene_type:complete